MTDAADHDKRTVAFPISDLTRRLLRRATEPVGVVDVRHAGELHSRSSLWSGQRLELLEGLRRRYGLDHTGGGPGHALPVASGRPFVEPLHRLAASPFDWASASSPASRDRLAEAATSAISEEPSASSAQHYRVKRPGRYVEPNPSAPLSSETVATRSHAVAGIQARTPSVASAQLLRKSGGTQSPDGGRPEASALQLVRAADTRPADEPAPQHDDPPAAAALPQAGELPRSVAAAPMPLRLMPDGPAEIVRSGIRDDLPGGNTSTLSGPTSTELPPAGGGIGVNAHFAAATQLERPAGDTQSSAGSRPEVFALPLVRAGTADTSRRVDEERAPGHDDPPVAGALPQVSEVPRSAVAAPMPLQRMPDGSVIAESSRSSTQDGLSDDDASILSNPSSTALSPAANGIRVSTNSVAATQPERTTGDTRSPTDSSPGASALPLVRVATADTWRRVGDEHALSHDDARAAGTLPQVSELPRSTIAAQMPLQRVPDVTIAGEIDRPSTQDGPSDDGASASSSPSSTELPPAASRIRVSTHSAAATRQLRKTGGTQSPTGSWPDASALPLARAADIARRVDDEPAAGHARSLVSSALPQVSELPSSAVAVPLQRMPDGSATGAIERSIMRGDLPGGSAFPLSSPSSARPHPQREADHPLAFPADSSVPIADTIGAPPHANAHAQFRGAVSAEIRVAPPLPGSTSIVWRKADVNGASRESAATGRAPTTAPTYANGTQIMRADASEAAGPSAAPDAAPASESNGVDIILIAEQVSRIISRQLRVERERRGRRR
jgi:hypothetical protein